MRKWLGTNKRDVDSFEFRPDSDKVIHSFYCEDNLIFMTRTLSSQPLMGGYMDVPFTPESLTLTVWGSNNAVLQKLLQDAVQAAVKQRTADSLYIYTQSDRAYLAGSWVSFMREYFYSIALFPKPNLNPNPNPDLYPYLYLFFSDSIHSLLSIAGTRHLEAREVQVLGHPGQLLHGEPARGRTGLPGQQPVVR